MVDMLPVLIHGNTATLLQREDKWFAITASMYLRNLGFLLIFALGEIYVIDVAGSFQYATRYLIPRSGEKETPYTRESMIQ